MTAQLGQRVERAGGGLLHVREPWSAIRFAEPQVERISIVPWGADGLRVRVTVGPRILDTAWALTEPPAPGSAAAAAVTVKASAATVRNGRISARLTERGPGGADARLEFFRHPGAAGATAAAGATGAEPAPIPILAEHDYVVGCRAPRRSASAP